jgi:hypothetical protein
MKVLRLHSSGVARSLGLLALSFITVCTCAHAQRSNTTVLMTDAAALDDALGAADDARMLELVVRRPTYTLIRLDEIGTPQVRMDLYFGSRLPGSREELLSLAERFSFGSLSGDSTIRRDDPADASKDGWRTLVLPEATAPLGKPEMGFFERDMDLAIEFRSAVQPLSCSLIWYPSYDSYNNTGWGPTWYAYSADAVTYAAQARRDKNTNPNLYLYRWTSSYWQQIDYSTHGAWMDRVFDNNSSCAAKDYKLRVYMANEGYWSCLGVIFRAN